MVSRCVDIPIIYDRMHVGRIIWPRRIVRVSLIEEECSHGGPGCSECRVQLVYRWICRQELLGCRVDKSRQIILKCLHHPIRIVNIEPSKLEIETTDQIRGNSESGGDNFGAFRFQASISAPLEEHRPVRRSTLKNGRRKVVQHKGLILL